jgi:hypothetical protein
MFSPYICILIIGLFMLKKKQILSFWEKKVKKKYFIKKKNHKIEKQHNRQQPLINKNKKFMPYIENFLF